MAKPANRSAPKRGGTLFAGILIGVVLGAVLAGGVALWSSGLNPFRQGPPAVPLPPSGKPEAPPDLDFYRALPSDEPLRAPVTPPEPAATPVYFLQAGAFAAAEEADNLRARLALLGVEAGIKTETEGDQTLHRLRVGPFTSMASLNETRSLLEANLIPTMLVIETPKQEETP